MSRDINAVLIDDELLCIENLSYYLRTYCPGINIVGTSQDCRLAEPLLLKHRVDLIFLDIHLVDHNSFDWLSSSGLNIPVVFVTAYEQYALSAFKSSALDYILKPLEKDEILRCYRKINGFFTGMHHPPQQDRSRKITLRQGDALYIIHPDNIIVLKAKGFYTDVCFEHDGIRKTLIIAKPISQLCEEWQGSSLMRVHRSYAVNLNRIISVRKQRSGMLLRVGSEEIPVAGTRNEEFISRYKA